jgi:hypothetical protein
VNLAAQRLEPEVIAQDHKYAYSGRRSSLS